MRKNSLRHISAGQLALHRNKVLRREETGSKNGLTRPLPAFDIAGNKSELVFIGQPLCGNLR
jgi:hypothetical protein